MKKLLLATLLTFAPLSTGLTGALGAQDTTRLRWVPNPRVRNGGWVSDPANHLRAETITEINGIIAALERETTAEIAVAVLDSLDGLEPGAAALLLHRRWGVGKIARDNGLVLLWSPKLRRIHVSVGYGLEGVITDARAGRIQDDSMLPRFRRNEFDAGMTAGVRALAARAREEKYLGPERARASSPGARVAPANQSSPAAAPLGGFIGVGVLGVLAAMGLWLRNRPRKCPKGHGSMRRLSESQDDAFLVREAILEEQLGSMNYEVWQCATCDERLVISRRKWFTSYEDCPQCKRRTVQVDKRQIRAPTYSTTGEREITRHCQNCGCKDTQRETIAMLVRSESSSSSGGGFSSGGGGGGGSSFGGGSSGGGGAGRSY